MIFNQSRHELQVGTIEIVDGRDYVILAINGTKKCEPTVVLTPQGTNANLNTFVVDRAKWGSIIVPIDGGVNSYSLQSPWVAKATNEVYNVQDNLAMWWKCNDQGAPIADIIATVGGVSSHTITGTPSQTSDNPGNNGHIQSTTIKFQPGETVGFRMSPPKDLDKLITGEAAGNPMSISMWYKPTMLPVAGRDVLVKFGSGWGHTVGDYREFSLEFDPVSMSVLPQVGWSQASDNGNVTAYVRTQPMPSFNAGEWHHLVFTRNGHAWTGDGTKHWKIYVDGMEIQVTGMDPAGEQPVNLATSAGWGVFQFSDAWAAEAADGDLADVAIWNVQLSDENIRALYNARILGVQEGIEMTGQNWFSLIKRSTDTGDETVQYQAIGASPLRVK